MDSPTLPSVLEGLDIPAKGPGRAAPKATPAARPRVPSRGVRLGLPFGLDDRLNGWWRGRMEDPKKKKKTLLALRVGGGTLGAALVVWAAVAFWPVRQPDYLNDPLDDVFNYTLLTDDFNKLPVEERLKLIGQLVQRLRSMDGQDSMLMASFAMGIAGAARKQIEENASRLAVDTWDKYAKDYSNVPESERGRYLDETFVNFVKMMEAVGGEVRDVPDEQRLAEVRRQAERDRERLRDNPNRAPSGRELGRFFNFMDRNVGGHASPEQRQRGMLMMRDMVRHFRGQDPATGKPPPG
ncbi:MAG: hypothetical protein KF864_04350 [Phycisphaeraceae bacterium]|nr:hypothetical protein [Phycisphaeraceae bacterium]